MGNYRFKLSAMIPSAWFYKLKDMNRSATNNNTLPPSKKNHPLHQSQDSSSSSDLPLQHHHSSSSLPRKSYYLPRDLSPKLLSDTHQHQLELQPPRRSSKLSSPRPKRPPPPCRTSSASCSCRASLDSVWTTKTTESSENSICESSPEFRFDRVLTPDSFGNPCECGGANNNTDDIFIHVDENSFHGNNDLVHQEDHMLPQLPRIVTKPAVANLKDCDGIIRSKNRETQKSEKLRAGSKAPSVVVNHKHKHQQNNGSGSSGNSRKFSLIHSPGKRLRIRSHRIQAQLARRMDSKRRSLSESFAIVKSSFDPHKDFRESMLEMIVEHNIKASKDLEELLVCFLSLNSDEYHELIIKVFKQIWFDLTDIISFK